jgi:glycosyltransferase involved in cell wall biosynthesis
MGLSVVIITKNEAANIRQCIGSASFADEWIVLDSESADGTCAIAKSCGAKVFQSDSWPGFGAQKNAAIALASGDWILSLDADEQVSPALASEIQAALAKPEFTAYRMPRRSKYCGQTIHHSGWSPDYVTRLFKRGSARFSDDLVHERLLTTGTVGTLKAPLLHASYTDFDHVIEKMNRYSSASALGQYRSGRRVSLWTGIWHGLWAFMRTYILRRGFLDGQMGLALAISIAQGTYYRYAKLWLLGKQPAD